jgi:hypothetical protein
VSITRQKLEVVGCAQRSCWVKNTFTDAGITAIIGPNWDCLLLDRHFSGVHGCISKKARKGGFCDGVAIHPQMCRTRLIEIKTGPRVRDARAKLKIGAEWLLDIPGSRTRDVVAECHMRAAPRSSYRPRPINVETSKGRKARIPFSVWAKGNTIV